MDFNSKAVKVAVCIANYKRPLGLRRLLNSLRDLKFNKSQNPDWHVVIIENDSSQTNKSLVDLLKRDFPVPVIYGVETKRGIASTRNQAVQLSGNVDFIAFIDDDEVADSGWLDELLFSQKSYNADVITGPVVPRFEETPPAWVLKGHFYDRPHHPTGMGMKCSATGNVLVKSHWLTSVPKPFDEQRNLTGGEDALFFTQIYQQGANIIWTNEAVVFEYNPRTRVSFRWLLQRAFRNGNDTSILEIMIGSSFPTLMIRALKGAIHILIGLGISVPAMIYLGYAGLIQGLCFIGRGMGEISGLFGIRYKEYKTFNG